MQPGFLFHALLPRRSWAGSPSPTPTPSPGLQSSDSLRVPIFFSRKQQEGFRKAVLLLLWLLPALCNSMDKLLPLLVFGGRGGPCPSGPGSRPSSRVSAVTLPRGEGREACCPLAPFSLLFLPLPRVFFSTPLTQKEVLKMLLPVLDYCPLA